LKNKKSIKMNNFYFSDDNDYLGVDDAKIQRLPPTFNSKNVLQFDLSPGGALSHFSTL